MVSSLISLVAYYLIEKEDRKLKNHRRMFAG